MNKEQKTNAKPKGKYADYAYYAVSARSII